jgi:hypothetical protein
MYSNVTKYLGLKHEEKAPLLTGNTPYYEAVTENYTEDKNTIDIDWKTSQVQTSNPYVWGPAFWLSFHVSAAYYPVNPSKIVSERMKQRILAIPYELPCSSCRPHAISFIEPYRVQIAQDKDGLDLVVSSRENLVKFYVDFHNYVNKRFGKKQWSYKEAEDAYSGKANVNYLSYRRK